MSAGAFFAIVMLMPSPSSDGSLWAASQNCNTRFVEYYCDRPDYVTLGNTVERFWNFGLERP